DAAAAFAIRPSQSLAVNVSSDRAGYVVGDRVLITGSVRNTSGNVELSGLTATIQILDANGVEAFRSDEDLGTLFLDAQTEVSAGGLAATPGSYTARLVVRSATGELSAATAAFTATGSVKLTGQLQI